MPAHDSFHRYILELNKIYLKKAAIWELDHTYEGFKWVDCKSDNKCVFAYTRTTKKNTVFAVFNFSDKEATIEPKLNGNLNSQFSFLHNKNESPKSLSSLLTI